MLSKSVVLQFLIANRQKGLIGEKIAKEDYQQNGFKIISTRIGSDFIAYKKINGIIYREYVEVKTGKSKQSIIQKKKMRELKHKGINYTLYRVSEKFLSNYILLQKSAVTTANIATSNENPDSDSPSNMFRILREKN
jgi:Holliday junction resolvase-like predicted endonuclease